MKKNTNIDRVYSVYEQQIKKDNEFIEKEKYKFIYEVKNGLGKKLSDVNSYIKKDPSIFQKIKNKIIKIFRYL